MVSRTNATSDIGGGAQGDGDECNPGDRYIDGLRYPRAGRQIDPQGFEVTKHALHFRGPDWDIPLSQERDALTQAFIQDASDATSEPPAHISNLRFVVSDTYLNVKFCVRHKTHKSVGAVQHSLADYPWTRVRALYKPRQKKRRADVLRARQESQTTFSRRHGQTPAGNLSFFGRANVGPEGPSFQDKKDTDEEPAVYEQQQEAKQRQTTSFLMVRVGMV